jgi:hypothetical protein
MNERHGGPLPGRGRTGHGGAEVVDQLTDGLFGLLVTGFAGACRRELAEQPQQQEWLVRHPDLADSSLAQSGEPRQQLVTSHPNPAGCAFTVSS